MTEELVKVEQGSESPLKQYFDAFDVERIDWTDSDYIKYATNLDLIDFNTGLLTKDWGWRNKQYMNVVASIEGEQGSGKSLFFCYAGLLLGNLFGVPFKAENIFFSPFDLDEALQHAKQKETFLRDEHRNTAVGHMSHMINENLSDYEDQLRKHQNNLLFASPQLQNHSHFFVFETKHILRDLTAKGHEDGYPTHIIAMLKTPRYTDRTSFVWRGYVKFPSPSRKFWEQYDVRKEQHLINLKAKYGGDVFAPVDICAHEIYGRRKEELIKKNADQTITPINALLMEKVITSEIGSTKFPMHAYNYIKVKIANLIRTEYADHNDAQIMRIEAEKQAKKEERETNKLGNIAREQEKAEQKLKLFAVRLEAEKKRAELKAKALELKEKELGIREQRKKEGKADKK